MHQRMMEVFFRFHKLKIFRILPEISQSDVCLLAKLMVVRENQGERQGIRVSELAEKLELSVPSVSRTLNHLEKKGYVTRYEGINDRRITYVCLTDKGRDILEKVDTVMRDYWGTVISRMDPVTMEHLMDGIDEFYRVAEEELLKRLQEKENNINGRKDGCK